MSKLKKVQGRKKSWTKFTRGKKNWTKFRSGKKKLNKVREGQKKLDMASGQSFLLSFVEYVGYVGYVGYEMREKNSLQFSRRFQVYCCDCKLQCIWSTEIWHLAFLFDLKSDNFQSKGWKIEEEPSFDKWSPTFGLI